MKNQHNPKHNKLQDRQELEKHEVLEVLKFLKQYGKMIGAGVIAAIVVVIATRGVALQKATELANAEQALFAARTPAQLEEVIKNYKSTPTAQVARLQLAKTHFNNGNTALAREQYELFVRKNKKNELRPSADLGLAYCTEAEGNFDEAAAQFAEFIQKNEGSYLQPMAILSMARNLKQAGKTEEARVALEDMLTENAGNPWSREAEEALRNIGK